MTANGALLLVRADASPMIGTGHVMRTMTLAQEWIAAGGRAGILGDGVASLAADGNVEIYDRVQSRAGSQEDGARTAREARERGATWVVIDGYAFDLPYQEELRAAGCPALLIADHSWPVGPTVSIILNQNIDAPAAHYDAGTNVELLLGPEFALLRPEFVKARARAREIAPTGRRILVSMGGADPTGATEVVLSVLSQVPAELEIIAVVGAANPRVLTIIEAAPSLELAREGSSVRVIAASKSMADLLQWADVAIVAGGSTVWELMCVGTPGVIVVAAENQVSTCAEIQRRRLGVVVDGRCGFEPKKLKDAIVAVLLDSFQRTEIRMRGMKAVDGRGAARVLSRLALWPGDQGYSKRLGLANRSREELR